MNSNSHDYFDLKEQRHSKNKRWSLVPEQGVRLAVVVPIFMMIGFYAIEESNSYVFTWALWVAMTMVLVSSNEMGGVMTDGVRRFSGALITGILATAVVWIFTNENLPSNRWFKSDAIIVAVAGMFVMYIAQVFVQMTGYKRTTVMVCQLFIKCCFVGKANNFMMVWSIILGVCVGVLMICIVSVLIFPRSSSYQALIKLKIALEKLEKLSKHTMHELITASIDPGEFEDSKYSEFSVRGDLIQQVQVEGGGEFVAQLTQIMKIEDTCLRQCEHMMYSIYDTLESMKAHLKASRNEIYVTQRQTKDGPKWVLLPGAKIFRCICMNPLPYDELEYVQYNIKRVARHLWAVLLSIDHMWDETVNEVIKQRYPQEVLPRIHDLTTGVLKDIACAFPSQHFVSRKNLSRLEMHVEMMLNISNRWRTRAAVAQNKNDTLTQQGRQRLLKRAATRTERRTPTSLALTQMNSGVLNPAVRSRTSASPASSPLYSSGVLASRAISAFYAPAASPKIQNMQMVVEDEQASVSQLLSGKKLKSKSVRFSSDPEPSERQESIMKIDEDNDDEEQHSPFLGIVNYNSEQQVQSLSNIASDVLKEDSGASKSEADPELGQPLVPKPIDPKKSLGKVLFRQLKRVQTIVRTKKNLKVEVKQGQRQQRRETAHIHSSEDLLPTRGSKLGSQFNLEKSVSDKDSVAQGDNTSTQIPGNTRLDSATIDSIEFDLPLVEEQLVLSFPESEEGHTQEARWYSFQFQIDELLDAIIELHTGVNDLLEQHLPKLSLTQKLIDRYQVRQYY